MLRWYREWLQQAPDDVYDFFAVLTVPPDPPFPEQFKLQKVCGIIWCDIGPRDRADQAFVPALDAAKPLLHGVHEMPYPMLQRAFDGLYPPGHQWYWRGDFIATIPDAAINRHLEFAEKAPLGQSTMHLYPIDGGCQSGWPERHCI